MQTSANGRAFIRAHEGDVLTAYLDPVGVPTIGVGFTNRAPTVTRLLGKLKPGRTKITKEQSDAVFREVLAADFEPAVANGMPGAKQHEFDAGVSGAWNLGARFMTWEWAKRWRSGDKKGAASYLASHYNTAGGRKLPGLVRRRKEEAVLLLTGKYTGVRSAPEGEPRNGTTLPPRDADPVVKEAQELLTARGFNPGAIDGWMGAKTKAAIIAYQKAHPHLIADGVLGPATLAQLRRDAQAAKDALSKGGGSVGGIGALSWAVGLPWGWIAIVAALAVAGYFAWRYRDVIERRWNTLRGKEKVV